MFAGVGERTREGTQLYREMLESGVMKDTVMVFGQMNEPAGVRLRVALTALSMAEYFRDQGSDVLLFIDNIFRFTMSGSEVSALLGRMLLRWIPANTRDGMGELQERINSTGQVRLPPCRRYMCRLRLFGSGARGNFYSSDPPLRWKGRLLKIYLPAVDPLRQLTYPRSKHSWRGSLTTAP